MHSWATFSNSIDRCLYALCIAINSILLATWLCSVFYILPAKLAEVDTYLQRTLLFISLLCENRCTEGINHMLDNPLHIPMPILMLLSRFSHRILLLGYIFQNTFHKLANLVVSCMHSTHLTGRITVIT